MPVVSQPSPRISASVWPRAQPIPPLPHTMQGRLTSILSFSGVIEYTILHSGLEPKIVLEVVLHPPKITMYRDFGDTETDELGYLAQR
jgi:hypothetical protein